MASNRLFCPMVRIHSHHLEKENKAPFTFFYIFFGPVKRKVLRYFAKSLSSSQTD